MATKKKGSEEKGNEEKALSNSTSLVRHETWGTRKRPFSFLKWNRA